MPNYQSNAISFRLQNIPYEGRIIPEQLRFVKMSMLIIRCHALCTRLTLFITRELVVQLTMNSIILKVLINVTENLLTIR